MTTIDELRQQIDDLARRMVAKGWVTINGRHVLIGEEEFRPRKEPKLKPPLYRGREGDSMARSAERAREMERLNPGVEFSLYDQNPLGVKQAQREGQPGAGLPGAMYPRHDKLPSAIAPTDRRSKLVLAGARRWGQTMEPGWTGYVSFTALSYGTGLPFDEVFGVVRGLREEDPYAVRFSVDRQGKPVYVNFALPKVKP